MNIDFKAVVDHCTRIITTEYCCFDGRVGQRDYWTYIVPVLIVSCIPLIGQLIALALLCPTLGMCARRLHDTGKSAMLLLVLIVPLIGLIAVLYLCYQPAAEGANEYGEPVAQ